MAIRGEVTLLWPARHRFLSSEAPRDLLRALRPSLAPGETPGLPFPTGSTGHGRLFPSRPGKGLRQAGWRTVTVARLRGEDKNPLQGFGVLSGAGTFSVTPP